MSPNPTVEQGIGLAPLSNRGHWTSVMLDRKLDSKRNQTGFRSCPLQIVWAMILVVRLLLETGTKIKAPIICYLIIVEQSQVFLLIRQL